MRSVLVLANVVALAVAYTSPAFQTYDHVKTETVDAAVVKKQHLILELFANSQMNINSEYYKIGKDYDIKSNVAHYKEEAVETFFRHYEKGLIPHFFVFNIFDNETRKQAKALYDVFVSAKDFESFYKAGAWARVNLNIELFSYSFYVASIQRYDTKGLVFPALYENFPQFFANTDIFQNMHVDKMNGKVFKEFPQFGIIKQGENYLYCTNYSSYFSYGDEYKLDYLTEDIGWNSFYAYFHASMPFWLEGEEIAHGVFKERRGEAYYSFHQNLLARYYLERLSNDMGEIPTFSWSQPFKNGYRPFMSNNFRLFVQRSDDYVMQNKYNLDDLRFIRNYEDMFQNFLQQGQFESYHKQIDFSDLKSINFVGNFWQNNPDLHEKTSGYRYFNSYEIAARRVLRGAPNYPTHEKNWAGYPTALDFYLTSLRDPAFYQLYNKIFGLILKYKEYLQPYTQENLHYVGVKVNNVEVSKLETFFDFYSYNASNSIHFNDEELEHNTKQFVIGQPRLNHESFKVKFAVESDVEEQATFKVFLGPKYDSYGNVIQFENNWMNFVKLDWFTKKLNKGENVFERSSNEFFFYKEDSLPIAEIYKLLDQSKLPLDMAYNYNHLPNRLMLPRGTKGGFPLQFFVAVYKTTDLPKEYEGYQSIVLDDKPFEYPLDRPVSEFFLQPNMYVKDVTVYHKGSLVPNTYDFTRDSNEVSKH